MTKEELARQRAGGAEIVPPPPVAQEGSPDLEQDGPLQEVLPVEVKAVKPLPKVNASKKYLNHRQSAHSEEAEIAALEKQLGMDEPVTPVEPMSTEQQQTPTLVAMLSGQGWDAAKQFGAGVVNGFNELGNGILDAADWAEKNTTGTNLIESGLSAVGAGSADRDSSEPLGALVVGNPNTVSGRIAEGIGRFTAGFLPSNRLMQGVKIVKYAGTARIVKAAASGAITDFAFFDPHTERLSNLVKDYPVLGNAITRYLAADPNDSEIEGRFKNALEGLGLGVAADGLLHGLKAYRGWQALKNASRKPIDVLGNAAAPAARGEAKAATAGGAETITRPASGPVAEAGTATSPATKGSITENSQALQDTTQVRQRTAQPELDLQRSTDEFFDEAMGNSTPVPGTRVADNAAGNVPRGNPDAPPGPPPGVPVVSAGPGVEEISPITIAPRPADLTPQGIIQPEALDLPGNRAININLEKVDASTDVRAVIANIAKGFEPGMQRARGYRPDEQLRLLAKELDMTPEDLLARQPGEAYSDAQILVARGIVNSGANKLVELAQAAAKPGATAAEKAAFLRGIEGQRQIQQQLTGAIAESGRALRASKLPVGIPEEAAKAEAVSKMLVDLAGPQDVNEMARIFSEIKDPAVVARIMRQSMTRRLSDVVHYTWINGLLGGARTVAVNITGNAAAAAHRVIETSMGEVFGRLRAGAKSGINNDRVVVGEARALVRGYADSMMDAFRQARDFMLERQPIDEYSSVSVARRNPITKENFGLTGMTGKMVDYLGIAIGLPTRIAGAADRFARTVQYRGSLHQMAQREAVLRGLGGEEKEEFLRSFLLNPPDEFHFRAMDDAGTFTFTNPLPDTAEKIVETLHDPETLVGQVGRYVVPFMRTNLNITGYGLQRMPILNRLSPRMRADLLAGGARADMARAKVATGSAIMATAAYYASEGRVTGAGPSDYKVRQALESTGWRPYSVKIGDTYYSINRLDPYGKLLGMAADFVEIAGKVNNQRADLDDAALLAVDAVLNTLSTERMVESSVQFGEVVLKPQDNLPKYVSNLAASFVPNWLAQFAREGGEVKKDTGAPVSKIDQALGRFETNNSYFDETINKMKARIPGYGADLPARRNLFGEPEVYDKGWGADMGIPGLGWAADILSPVMVSKAKDSPIRAEIARLALEGREFSMPKEFIPTKIGGIPLTPKEYERYSELAAGIGLHEAMKSSPESVRFKRTLEDELNYQLKNNFPTVSVSAELKKTDEWRYAMISTIINDYRKMAAKAIGGRQGSDLPKRYETLYKAKKKNVIGPGGER